MEKVIITTGKQFKQLESASALTWEGMDTSDDNLQQIKEWVESCGVDTSNIVFNIISGKDMNSNYGLTGSNAYQSDLSIVSLTGIETVRLAIPRFQVGGRWFDDIVSNNSRREG